MADIWEQLSRYRQVKVLPDGLRILLRPLGKDDTAGLAALFERAAPEDLERFRSDPTDYQVVESWVRDLDLSRIFPLVVVVNDRIIGDVTIHFGSKFQRHLGWLRVFMDREFRRRGIGTLMIRTAIDIARRVGLHQLIALVPTDQPHFVKALEELGFRNEFVHQDYAILQDGHTLDVAELVLYLVDHSGEF
jgi:RimJ/RimL family protein N-acetyltransferase